MRAKLWITVRTESEGEDLTAGRKEDVPEPAEDMPKGTKPEERAERDARFKESGTTENANAQEGRMKLLGGAEETQKRFSEETGFVTSSRLALRCPLTSVSFPSSSFSSST